MKTSAKEIFEVMDDIFAMSKTMQMNTERTRRWENAVKVLTDEMLLSQANDFKDSVMKLAKDMIGKYATEQDVITIISDKTTDNQKIHNVYLNTERKGSDAESVVAMKEVKSQRWQNGKSASIRQYSLDGKFITEYTTVAEASVITGISKSCLFSALKGRTRSSGGYIWKRTDDETPIIPCIIKTCSYAKPIGQYSVTGKLTKQYKSIQEAARETGITYETIRRHLDSDRTLNGYKWKSI